jgi:PAS domain S-box-containing protein
MSDVDTRRQRPTRGLRADEANTYDMRETHLVSVLRSVRNVNQLIVREKDRNALLARACSILTETRGYLSAWVAEADGNGRAGCAHESGIGAPFPALRERLLASQWPLCAQQALAGKGVAVLHDPKTECGACPLADGYRGAAALSAPLRHGDRDYGVLTVALPSEAADVEEERELVREVAGDLGLALHTLELEDRRLAGDAREAHLKQVLLAIRNVNQMIVHEENPQRLIERACANLAETLGYFNAWIALLDGDGERAVATASAGLAGPFDALRARLERGEFSSCMRRTLERDATVVTAAPLAECADCPLVPGYGGRAGYSRRLAFEGRTYGILAVSVPVEYVEDKEEQGLFDEVADDLAFALHKIELGVRLRESEDRIRAKLNALLAPEGDVGELSLADVLDVPAIQAMMDDFLGLTGIGVAILDARGKVLVATGWKDICTKFHRVHPDTRRHCIESDTELSSGVEPGAFKFYRCKNNLWDVATPIILENRHVGNVFFGQFFFEDETLDREVFRSQARQCGFDEGAYLAALDQVPRWSRERVCQIMTFYAALARQLSDLSYGNIKLARTLSQRDELLARLGENEARLRLALRATNDVVWDWDVVNDSQRWSEAGVAMFGWTDIVHTPQTAAWWVERVHPEDRQRVHDGFFAAVNALGAERWQDEYRFRKADGTYAHVEDRAYILRDANGRATRMIGAMLDITGRERAEAEREKLQAQLFQAQKMESVGRLAGGVAHDFNNLLMGIMGYAQLCREEVASDHPIQEYLHEITHEAERSAEITRQLLAFARKQTIAPKVLDINGAVAGMFKLLQRLIGEDIKMTWRPGADLPQVRIDPSQVDQILANLCVNARDAIAGVGEIALETGSIAIDAEYCAKHPEAIPGAYVFLAVSDNGCGMDKETLAHIFEPFFTTKGLGKGTGLGLATVYGIVKQNNGLIYADSEPGRGTTCKICLPAIAAAVEAPVTAKAAAPRGRGETILVVEDEKSLRVTCGAFLDALGYEVLAAETPGEALKKVAEHPGDIHMLLTDVVMPGMDGWQLAQRLGAVRQGLKVLFISGYTSDVIAQRGVLDEGMHFLSKPFTRDDLARKVREVLESD